MTYFKLYPVQAELLNLAHCNIIYLRLAIQIVCVFTVSGTAKYTNNPHNLFNFFDPI